MNIHIKKIDENNYLVNQKPVYREKNAWGFSYLITQEEANGFISHLKSNN